MTPTGLTVKVKVFKPKVDKKKIHLSKKAEEEVEWNTDSSADIEFEESPFTHGKVFKSSSGVIHSGPISADAVIGKEYKYSIKWDDGELDPHVIIDP